ncbi:MAG: tRNA pseudouridine(55) synthase TruB, partial [Burkholderiales bacterium]|nr:tRNA pseudouridine(55) synthase TruB [Burkholderiales bacterium]
FVGEILQTPPMYSAIKHAGKPLYRYARAGIAVDRAPRCVHIRRLVLDGFSGNDVHISLACSKGTYVRVLAEDIGRALGCGACLSALRRTVIGQFTIDGALPFDVLQAMTTNEREAHLKPVDTLAAALPRIDLDAAQTRSIRSGVVVGSVEHAAQGLVRLYGPGERYLGIAMVEPPGRLVPRRLMATSP